MLGINRVKIQGAGISHTARSAPKTQRALAKQTQAKITTMSRLLESKKNLYLNRLLASKEPFLEAVKRAAQQESVEKMQISDHEGRILHLLTHISGAKKAVEIGTLYGFSTLHIARALPQKGIVFTLDNNPERHKKAQEILKKSPDFCKIQWMTGPALKSLKALESQAPFDMVFIDADKSAYEDYLSWAERNLKPGGLLVADNVFLFGAVYGEEEKPPSPKALQAMKRFNERISGSPLWKGALIPTDEGLALGVRQ